MIKKILWDADLMKIWYFSLEMHLGQQAIKDKPGKACKYLREETSGDIWYS